MPSNLLRAVSIAARRAAGRGGGALGSEIESSLSIAIHRVLAKCRIGQVIATNRSPLEGSFGPLKGALWAAAGVGGCARRRPRASLAFELGQ
jgi:hypothetical protein